MGCFDSCVSCRDVYLAPELAVRLPYGVPFDVASSWPGEPLDSHEK